MIDISDVLGLSDRDREACDAMRIECVIDVKSLNFMPSVSHYNK